MTYSQDDLINLTPKFDAFIGVDSDGCVFDTMTAKQCKHFHPLIIKHWGLEAIEPQLRKVAEFVNLRSKFRGQNRFIALLKMFDILSEQPDVIASGVQLPNLDAFREYCLSGIALGNATLMEEVQKTNNPELARILKWSFEVNKEIEQNMEPVPPFPSALIALQKMNEVADVTVVSQTPEEALLREWNHHEMTPLARIIGGQELGRKAQQITLATDGKYPKSRILLIGDAIGDYNSARTAGVSFFPIQPGDEERSWQRFHEEVLGLFLVGRYSGLFENAFISRFVNALPDKMQH